MFHGARKHALDFLMNCVLGEVRFFFVAFTWNFARCHKSRLTVSFHRCKNVFVIFFLIVEHSTSKVYEVFDCSFSSCACGDALLYTSSSRKVNIVVANATNFEPALSFCIMGSRGMDTTNLRNFIARGLFVFPQRWKKQNTPQQMERNGQGYGFSRVNQNCMHSYVWSYTEILPRELVNAHATKTVKMVFLVSAWSIDRIMVIKTSPECWPVRVYEKNDLENWRSRLNDILSYICVRGQESVRS